MCQGYRCVLLLEHFLRQICETANPQLIRAIPVVKPECEKNYTHQRETTGSSSDSLRLCTFSKWKLLLKERSELFPLRAAPYGIEIHSYHIR